MLTKILTPFLLALLMMQLRAADAGNAREKSRVVATVDATSLRGKVLCGYQGWFRCPGDDSKEGWIHWSHDSGHLHAGSLSFELWPDITEFSAPEKFAAPGFTNAQGEQACLFSSDQSATIRRHFNWMRDSGIDGVWLQHFVVDLPGGPLEGRYASRSRVLTNVRAAARETGRAWAIAFDIAGMPTNKIFDVLAREWRKLVDQGVTGDDRYVHEAGRPAVLIWGFYYQDPHNAMTPEVANQLIDFFKAPGRYRASLVGGGDWAWRYNPDSAWKDFLRRFDGYSPWNVGNVSTDKQKILHAAIGTWAKDKRECDRRGMLWLPVVYPGFSWDNLQKLPSGSSLIPRRKGDFLWEQFHALSKLGADSVCVAMFDEVDEGTAIFKVSNAPPSPGHFVTYEGMPNDWYLRLVGEGTRMLREKQAIPLKSPSRLNALVQHSFGQFYRPQEKQEASATESSRQNSILRIGSVQLGSEAVTQHSSSTIDFANGAAIPRFSRRDGMKRTASIWMAVLLPGLISPIFPGARACTVFCDSQDGTVLAGRNWDMWDDGTRTVMWFVPADNADHGRICFGRHEDTEDGMNDQGLFMAIAATPPSGSFWSSHATVFSSQALDGVLAHCASVEEAIAWLKKSPNILINGSARATSGFLGIYGKPRYSNSGVGGHYLIADKSGNSVVCEWVKGELKVVRKSARCQLMTNFLLSNPDMGNYPCPRLATLSSYFEKSGTPTVEAATRALQLASTGITRYSQVYDLAKGEVYLFFGHGFTNPMKFNLVAELAKGPREVELQELFRDQPEFLTFSRPKVTQPSALSADDVLSKAMEARGGVDALRRICSIHAKGNTILSFGWVDASPTEFSAHRPDRWRWVCDQKSLLGLNLGKLDTGFDGRKGWDCELGAAPKKLKGRVLQQNKESGEFFAWLADPAYYKSMQCLGEASFDGQMCYALKMVPKSGHEETHYYDKTSFLLAGLIHIVDTVGGATLQKETYGEYRAVGGFQFPARQSWQNKWWRGITQYRSIEVNCVEESALMMPTPHAAHFFGNRY